MRKAPYILLLTLFVILVFIVGVRYGQRVEKTNKTIDYLATLTPTGPVSPTGMLNVGFKSYTHAGCGVSFLYPSYLKPSEESTASAVLGTDDKDVITLSCIPTAGTAGGKTATQEATFQGRSLVVTKRTSGGSSTLSFFLAHPLVNKKIAVTLEESLYPLFEKSLEFELPATPAQKPVKTATPSAQ